MILLVVASECKKDYYKLIFKKNKKILKKFTKKVKSLVYFFENKVLSKTSVKACLNIRKPFLKVKLF